MQMKGLNLKSQNFTGEREQVLSEIENFLLSIKSLHSTKNDFQLVHALVFSKQMSEQDISQVNHGLSELYHQHGFNVLGGDTSSGQELNIFISTIVY